MPARRRTPRLRRPTSSRYPMAANHSGPIFLALSVLVSAPLPARAQPAPLVAIATDMGVVAPANSGINAGVQLSAQVRIPARGWAAIGAVARFETETEFLELTVTRLAG